MADGGGLLSGLGNTLGQILPMALPAAAGFALGGAPMGLAAGAAGAGAAAEYGLKQQESEMRKMELAQGWQKLAMENDQLQQAKTDREQWRGAVKGLGLKPEEEAFAMQHPDEWHQQYQTNQSWAQTVKTFEDDPEFAKEYGLTPSAVKTLGSIDGANGYKLLDLYTKAHKAGMTGLKTGVDPQTGMMTLTGLNPDGTPFTVQTSSKPVPMVTAGAALSEKTAHDVTDEKDKREQQWNTAFKDESKSSLEARPVTKKIGGYLAGAEPNPADMYKRMKKRGFSDAEITAHGIPVPPSAKLRGAAKPTPAATGSTADDYLKSIGH